MTNFQNTLTVQITLNALKKTLFAHLTDGANACLVENACCAKVAQILPVVNATKEKLFPEDTSTLA